MNRKNDDIVNKNKWNMACIWKLLLILLFVVFLAVGCGKKGKDATTEPAIIPTAEITEVPTASTEISTEATASTSTEEPTAATSTEVSAEASTESSTEETEETPALARDGTYTTKEDVALYLVLYGELPQNFITKKEAQNLGWTGGSLEPYAPGKCIGGDYFGNYEGILPEDRRYHECDIDTLGAKSRGAKRIVFSEDGLIYYTDDHYGSFVLLYGEE